MKMPPVRTETSTPAPRRPARDIIDAVVENMRQNLEPLKYSTLAPSRYTVYLHPSEYARLEGILPILRAQTIRALGDELQSLNGRSAVRRFVERWSRNPDPVIHNAAPEWQVEFLGDPDGEMKEGDLLVDSELVLPAAPDFGVGERTRRITTVHTGDRTTTHEQPSKAATTSTVQPLAQIEYQDDGGHHAYEVRTDSVTIGRGGIAYPVDVRIASSPDVSREHVRIRRDPSCGRFFLIDLSSLGTTLNGRHVPKGYDEVDGTKRENGAETELPDAARIGLADTVYIDFRAARR